MLCSLTFGRQPINGWNTFTGCYYNTSKPAYQPPWCSWNGVSCNSGYRVNYLSVWGSNWDPNSNYLTLNNMNRMIPTSLGSLKGLTSLSLGSWGFTGPLPSVLFGLTQLQTLSLGYNALTGTISTAITKLKQLRYLSFDGNRFNGTLPAVLSMYSNSLSDLPAVIPKNTALNTLNLGYNQIASTLPPSISNLASLNELDLSYNGQQRCNNNYNGQYWVYSCTTTSGFFGTLPSELYTLSSLNYITLTTNKFSGTISPMLSALTNLQTIRFSGNSFSGQIPTAISLLKNLYYVSLDFNQFSGKLPKIFGNTFNDWNWYYLLAHNNYFTGQLPSMPYSSPRFVYTFDQNCQLTSSSAYLGIQTHCKPGSVGQLTPTAFPSPSPTTRKSAILFTTPRHSLLTYLPLFGTS